CCILVSLDDPHSTLIRRQSTSTCDGFYTRISSPFLSRNSTPSTGRRAAAAAVADPKRLLWQNAVRHITEQRFIHEQGGGDGGGVKGIGSDDTYDPSQGGRKQSAGRTSVGDRHNNGGTKVFPERASSDLGFLQIDCAPSNSDFFLNWGYTYRGVIFPTLRNAFKSRDLERLYQRYFLGQRRKSVVVMNILDVDTTSHSYLQYSGVVTWVAMATQILAAGLGYGLLGDGVGYVLFTLFATYSMLPLPLTWAILAGLFTLWAAHPGPDAHLPECSALHQS
ncbi:unnamed protein product, partial [Lampetra planeri]